MSDDLVALYSGRILALAAAIPHQGRLPAAQGSARRRSPLCGSSITVDLALEQGRISAFAQDVKACALGQASAAIAGAVLPGRSRAEVQAARDQLAAMLREGAAPPLPPFDGYEVLTPAREYQNRHASILLVLDATLEAMQAADPA
ncbi:MAG: iron-sulfur cluster assembly scaffold protein [Gemmobacter sp.]|uniref:iron-sulfur cluster assembly scaffold protein n=1 Tax=Gemmobacter sp. TaxID=1898957 RepID=UPI001A45A4EB|nr:iron-sulfur cluster assembly scaffold protein [Gemmobacter sp.]MBL8562612.1 iron-sulfur cluster assembly scaffold protein [Gemmobacter sp.]